MGHPGAMADLGILYAMASESGEGQDGPQTLTEAGLVVQDLDVAVDLLERAAELGDATGMTALAHMYLEGTGVDKDEEKAHILFEQAALKVCGSVDGGKGLRRLNGCLNAWMNACQAVGWRGRLFSPLPARPCFPP